MTLRMAVSEQLAQSYQICMEEGREFDIDKLLRDCLRHQKENTLQEFVTKCLSEKVWMLHPFISGRSKRRISGASQTGTSASDMG